MQLNPVQKAVILGTAMLASLILHFTFCEWECGERYNAWTGEMSRQIIGVNRHPDMFWMPAHSGGSSFYGVSAKGQKSLAVVVGIVLPLLLFGGGLALFLSGNPSNIKPDRKEGRPAGGRKETPG